jgi:hypothetical protein
MEKLLNQINFELDEINELFKVYGKLIDKTNDSEPNEIELAALATIIHSFYNGIENIFLSILKNLDNIKLDNENWHKNLLNQMTLKTDTRNVVISLELKLLLSEFLAFRHFFRHSYSFHLEWEELKPLVAKLNNTKSLFETEINNFKINLR